MNQSHKIFHVGFHKTGTTHLQNHVLPHFAETLFTQRSSEFSSILDEYKYENWLHSDEGISGLPWGGTEPYDVQFYRNVEKCMTLFGVQKFIITVRPLKSWTQSLWKQHVHEGGTVLPQDFFNGNDNVLSLESCFMSEKIQWLQEKADVLVISADEIRKSELDVIEKISSFTGCDFDLSAYQNEEATFGSNIGIKSKRQVQFLLAANRLDSKLKTMHPGLSLKNKLSRRLSLTPRDIAQNRISQHHSEPFPIDFEFTEVQKDLMDEDWEKVKKIALQA